MFDLIRKASNVVVTKINDANRKTCAHIVVDDQYEHRFPSTSRVSKHLDLMTAEDLSERLTGGSYFFIENELVDFRDGQYNGFVHSDETIKVFMDLLGYQRKSELAFAHIRKTDSESSASQIVLRKVWNDHDIVVPGYQQGGDFSSQLSFVWNPYVKTVNSAFDLVRLICTNGMVGTTNFLNTKIPLFNRWEEHLDIAARQIQNKVNGVVVERIQRMSSERCSVADCLLVAQHAFDRLYSSTDKTDEERLRLLQLMHAADARKHLGSVYHDAVFDDKNLGSQLPAHLSNFDIFNIATELRSHTKQSAKSTDVGLDRFSNGVLFDREDNFVASASRYTTRATSSFACAERAFYGIDE